MSTSKKKCKNMFKPLMKKMSYELIVVPIGGIIVLAIFFCFLYNFFPSAYKGLTFWVSQPMYPKMKSCKFILKDSSDFSKLDITKDLKRYSVEFNIDTTYSDEGSIVLYTTENTIGLYDYGYSGNPSSRDKTYLVYLNEDFKNKVFKIDTIVDTENLIIRDGIELKYNECPIKLDFFGAK